MNIAYITSMYGRSSDTFIRNEVSELRARGHIVHTFSVREPSETVVQGTDVASARASTCYILSLPLFAFVRGLISAVMARPGGAWRGLKLAVCVSRPGAMSRLKHLLYFFEALYLASRLRDLSVNVLHNHIAENSATVAMIAAEVAGVPFSMTVHGPGIFFHPHHWALTEKIARAAFTACISDFCKSQCMLHSSLEHWHKLRVIRCAVGRTFEADIDSAPAESAHFVFVGRLCEEKGLPVLFEAVVQLARRGKYCHLRIIGDGPLKSYLEDGIRRENLQDSIQLLGWRSSEEVVRELRSSRALVLPSFAEGLPVVIMEALAVGRPVIATAIGGIPELVERGVNGWLVPAGSIDALTVAMGEAIDASAEALQAMGLQGHNRVRQMHSIDAEVRKLERCLANAVKGQTGEYGQDELSPLQHESIS